MGGGRTRATTGGGGEEGVLEYERQRQERIRENEQKLEALGLRGLSSSLRHSGRKQQEIGSAGGAGKGKKRRGGADDDEYRPSDESSSSQSEEEDEEAKGDDWKKGSSSSARKTPKQKGKNKNLSNEGARKKLFDENDKKDLEFVDDDDFILQQAIALSLGETMRDSNDVPNMQSQNSDKNAPRSNSIRKEDCSETAGKGKRKKGNARRVQLTEDEAVAYFFTFDEAGKGQITLRDLQKVAIAHDFCWSDKEMVDMVHLFDADGDGKLGLADFYKILCRCNILQDSRNS